MSDTKPVSPLAQYASQKTGMDLTTVTNYYAGKPTGGGLNQTAQNMLIACADSFRQKNTFELNN